MNYECDGCGIAACDLPDGVDPDEVFERMNGQVVLCIGCRGGGSVTVWAMDSEDEVREAIGWASDGEW